MSGTIASTKGLYGGRLVTLNALNLCPLVWLCLSGPVDDKGASLSAVSSKDESMVGDDSSRGITRVLQENKVVFNEFTDLLIEFTITVSL